MAIVSPRQDVVAILAADQTDEKVGGHDILLATFANLLSADASSGVV